MSRILFAWELGAGAGHMAPYRSLFEKLCARGHSVTLALRDLARAKNVFEGLNLRLLQAPVKINQPAEPIAAAATYADILHNVGYEDEVELEGLLSAWRSLVDLVQPELVIADHSPTALLALRGSTVKKIVVGCGFLIPPATHPFLNLQPAQQVSEQHLRAGEDRIRQRINAILRRTGQPPLTRLSELFSDVDDTVLTTYPELDHYPDRAGGAYWGTRRGFQGADFQWPIGDGPRIFAYLRPTPQFEKILQTLKDLKCPVIVNSDQIPLQMQRQYESLNLRFEQRLLNLETIGRECSVAILNGNHDTSCHLLLAGKPILFIPQTLEHWLFAAAVQRIGAGRVVHPERATEFGPALSTMLRSENYAKAAQQFAARYAHNDLGQIEDQLVQRIEAILEGKSRQKLGESPLVPRGEPLKVVESPDPAASVTPAIVSLIRRDAPVDAMNKPAGELIETAIAHHQAGRLREAAEIYEAILRKTPDDAPAQHLLGVVYLQAGQPAKAINDIARAIQLAPNEPSFYSNLGEAYRALNQLDAAIENFLTALRLKPQYPEACNNLALALQAQGKHKAAAARFREAIKYNPRYVAAYNNLAALLKAMGQSDEAQQCFAKAKQAAGKPPPTPP
jgi:tetratricopeptide (TPR) repeat protein